MPAYNNIGFSQNDSKYKHANKYMTELLNIETFRVYHDISISFIGCLIFATDNCDYVSG